MNKDTNKLIPELRFSEFSNNDTWKEKKLSEILFEHGYLSTGKEEVFSVSVHKGIINQIEHLGRSFSAANTDKYNRVLPGDIVYTKSPTGEFPFGIIKQSRLTQDVIVSPLYGVFSPENKYLGYILDAYFESIENTHNYLYPLVQKGAKNTINIKNETFLSNYLILPIDELEQKKIANCVSSLDELLIAHESKLKSLRAYKKSLLQRLFPQYGEKVPKLRFREFENDGEWKEKQLDQLGILINGLTYSPDDLREKGLLVLRSSNIQNGLIDLKDCVYVRNNINGANFSKPNDILVCVRNGSKALIGKNALIPENIPLATHGAFMTIFRAKYPKFIYQLLQTDEYNRQVRLGLGATINSINGKNFLKYNFFIPSNPEEQKKITDVLSPLDELIKEQADKVEQLKLHKKGLMQGLFPKVKN